MLDTIYQIELYCIDSENDFDFDEIVICDSVESAERYVKKQIELWGKRYVKAVMFISVKDEDGIYHTEYDTATTLHLGQEFLDRAFSAVKCAERQFNQLKKQLKTLKTDN